MKDFVCRMQSLLLFDAPFKNREVRELFGIIHISQQQQFPQWPLSATRKKIIASFWCNDVLSHFGLILLMSCLLVLPFGNQWQSAFPATLLAGFVSLSTLALFNYIPQFYSQFLPVLDTVMAEHEKTTSVEADIRKCKRTQLSIATLTIIFYVFAKTSKVPLPAANEKSAELLNNLYGADKDKLKQNLSRLYKIASLSPKERAEMLKGVEATRIFFETLDFPAAQKWLDELERKLQKAG